MKDLYWSRVEACLSKFHGFAPGHANAAISGTRKLFTEPNDGFPADEELIEHIDPFSMACTIAHNQLDRDRYQVEYAQLMHQTREVGISKLESLQPLIIDKMDALRETLEKLRGEMQAHKVKQEAAPSESVQRKKTTKIVNAPPASAKQPKRDKGARA